MFLKGKLAKHLSAQQTQQNVNISINFFFVLPDVPNTGDANCTWRWGRWQLWFPGCSSSTGNIGYLQRNWKNFPVFCGFSSFPSIFYKFLLLSQSSWTPRCHSWCRTATVKEESPSKTDGTLLHIREHFQMFHFYCYCLHCYLAL